MDSFPPAMQRRSVDTLSPLPPPLTPSFSELDVVAELEPPPAYSLDFKQAVRLWGEVRVARRELDPLSPILTQAESDLDVARNELDTLKRKR